MCSGSGALHAVRGRRRPPNPSPPCCLALQPVVSAAGDDTVRYTSLDAEPATEGPVKSDVNHPAGDAATAEAGALAAVPARAPKRSTRPPPTKGSGGKRGAPKDPSTAPVLPPTNPAYQPYVPPEAEAVCIRRARTGLTTGAVAAADAVRRAKCMAAYNRVRAECMRVDSQASALSGTVAAASITVAALNSTVARLRADLVGQSAMTAVCQASLDEAATASQALKQQVSDLRGDLFGQSTMAAICQASLGEAATASQALQQQVGWRAWCMQVTRCC